MLTLVLAVWAVALVVPGVLLVAVIAAQTATGQLRRLTAAAGPTPVGVAAEA